MYKVTRQSVVKNTNKKYYKLGSWLFKTFSSQFISQVNKSSHFPVQPIIPE